MPHWKIAGDVILSLKEDGTLHAQSTNGATAEVTIDEAAALHVARGFWGSGGGGATENLMTNRLAQWGVAEPQTAIDRLASKGFMVERGRVLSQEQRKKMPIFFIYCPRSGSNMLRWLLDAHPSLTCPPPSVIVHLLIEAQNHTWSAAAYRSMRLPKAWTRRTLRLWIERQMALVTEREKKPRWIYRHWVTYRSLHYIDELFGGNVLYVMLVRHGLDVADAACRVYVPAETWQAGPNGMSQDFFRAAGGSYHLAYAQFWREIADRMNNFRKLHSDRVHIIRYEDLVGDPDQTLGKAFTFLGEEMPQGLVEKAFTKPAHMLPAWEGHEVTRTSRVEKDRVGLHKLWDPGLIKAAAPFVNDGLEAFGYDRIPTE